MFKAKQFFEIVNFNISTKVTTNSGFASKWSCRVFTALKIIYQEVSQKCNRIETEKRVIFITYIVLCTRVCKLCKQAQYVKIK